MISKSFVLFNYLKCFRSQNLQIPKPADPKPLDACFHYIYPLIVISSIFLIIIEMTQSETSNVEEITKDRYVLKNKYGKCHNYVRMFERYLCDRKYSDNNPELNPAVIEVIRMSDLARLFRNDLLHTERSRDRQKFTTVS